MSGLVHALALVCAVCFAAYLLAVVIRIFGGLAICLAIVAGGLWLAAEAIQAMPSSIAALIPAALIGWCVWLAYDEKRRKP